MANSAYHAVANKLHKAYVATTKAYEQVETRKKKLEQQLDANGANYYSYVDYPKWRVLAAQLKQLDAEMDVLGEALRLNDLGDWFSKSISQNVKELLMVDQARADEEFEGFFEEDPEEEADE